SPSLEQPPLAWISLEDRAAGRTNVQFVIASDAPERDALAGALLDWAVEVGGSFARARGVAETQLGIDIHELDTDRPRLLTGARRDRAVAAGVSSAPARGAAETQLDIDIHALATARARLPTAAGYRKVRSWLHMRRPVAAEEATGLPAPRQATRVRPVHRHGS